MYEIFETLLKEKGLKAADVCRATGIKSPVFSEWKKGKSTPKQDKMIKIAKFLGVSVEYLMTGKESEVDYLYNDENSDLLIEITTKLKNDKDFAERVARYMRLSDEGKYDLFKQYFNENSKKDWNEERQSGAFILKHIAYALNKLDYMNEEDTRTWYNEESKDYHISIEDFGKLVQNQCFYVDKTYFIKEWWESQDDVTLIT